MSSYLLWITLIAVIAAMSFWHIRENDVLKTSWQRHFDLSIATPLIKFAWSRSLQLLLMIICLGLLLVIYDFHLQQARKDLAEAEAELVSVKQQLAQANTLIEAQAEPRIDRPAEEAKPVKLDAMSEVYNPEEYADGNTAAIDTLKKRYEEILVTHLFLKKCGTASTMDYHVIMSALSQEMASINAPGRLQNDILTAAKGSYKEMYSKSSCSGESIAALQTQYASYIASLSQNYVTP